MKKIEPSEIRKGDRVRMEQPGYDPEAHDHAAVEWIAKRDKYVPRGGVWTDSVICLLDRPVVLPTRPYSMVIPPEGLEETGTSAVLVPYGSEDLAWMVVGEDHIFTETDVRDLISKGWRVIEGPEVLP